MNCVRALAFCSIFIVAGSAMTGAQSSSSMAVSATVAEDCQVTPGRLDFGDYDPVVANASQPLDAFGTFDVTCTPGATVTIALGDGLHSDGSRRRMSSADGRSHLVYELYQDAGRTLVWAGADVVSFTQSGSAPTQVRVYGRVHSGQDVTAGSYADSVIITVAF